MMVIHNSYIPTEEEYNAAWKMVAQCHKLYHIPWAGPPPYSEANKQAYAKKAANAGVQI